MPITRSVYPHARRDGDTTFSLYAALGISQNSRRCFIGRSGRNVKLVIADVSATFEILRLPRQGAFSQGIINKGIARQRDSGSSSIRDL